MRAIGAPIQLPVLASPFHLMNLPSGRGLYGVWISTQFPNPVQSQEYSGAMWACDLTTDLPDFSLFSTGFYFLLSAFPISAFLRMSQK